MAKAAKALPVLNAYLRDLAVVAVGCPADGGATAGGRVVGGVVGGADIAVKQVASILPQTSSLITPGTRHRGNVPYDPTQVVAHPLQSPSGPCVARR